MNEKQKQTILQIRTVNNISIEKIAEIANIPVADVYYIEAGVSYPREVLDRVLGALSKLVGQAYTLENVGSIYPKEAQQKQPSTFDKRNHQPKQEAPYEHTAITGYDLATLKSVISGYLGFLKNISKPNSQSTLVRLQQVYDCLPARFEEEKVLYFSYEKRIAILEAVVGFKLLLVTVFPPTTHRNAALADVEQLYQRLLSARSLPPN